MIELAPVGQASLRFHSVAAGAIMDHRLDMNKFLTLAVILLIAWAVLRLALAVTGAFLHLLWIVAVILTILWVIGKIRGNR